MVKELTAYCSSLSGWLKIDDILQLHMDAGTGLRSRSLHLSYAVKHAAITIKLKGNTHTGNRQKPVVPGHGYTRIGIHTSIRMHVYYVLGLLCWWCGTKFHGENLTRPAMVINFEARFNYRLLVPDHCDYRLPSIYHDLIYILWQNALGCTRV